MSRDRVPFIIENAQILFASDAASARRTAAEGQEEATPLSAVAGAGAGGREPTAPATSFPTSDEALSRTLVYDHPSASKTTQTLVTVWASGDIEVAERPNPGASWGPPWTLRELETWS